MDFYPNPLLINPEGTNSVLVPQNSTQFSQFFIPFLNLNIKSLTELPGINLLVKINRILKKKLTTLIVVKKEKF